MKTNFDGSMLARTGLVGAALLMGACVSQTNARPPDCKKIKQTSDVYVQIQFEEKCPKSVDKGAEGGPPFDVLTTNRIIWQAVDSDGSIPSYEIFFDPFKGGPLKSDIRGERKSPKFDSCSPQVEYKYTIVGDECRSEPLDPRFRLR